MRNDEIRNLDLVRKGQVSSDEEGSYNLFPLARLCTAHRRDEFIL